MLLILHRNYTAKSKKCVGNSLKLTNSIFQRCRILLWMAWKRESMLTRYISSTEISFSSRSDWQAEKHRKTSTPLYRQSWFQLTLFEMLRCAKVSDSEWHSCAWTLQLWYGHPWHKHCGYWQCLKFFMARIMDSICQLTDPHSDTHWKSKIYSVFFFASAKQTSQHWLLYSRILNERSVPCYSFCCKKPFPLLPLWIFRTQSLIHLIFMLKENE